MNPQLLRFLGTWQFVPELARYEAGAPPKEALYHIRSDGDQLLFAAEWTTQDGQHLHVAFTCIPDGQEHPYENPEVAETLCCEMTEAGSLHTTTRKGGRVLAVGRRDLSDDGQTLTVTQSGVTPQGQPFANVAVYKKG